MNALLRCLDCAAVLHTDSATGELVDDWGERTCSASYRAPVPDVPTYRRGGLRRMRGKTEDRRRGGLITGGAGAYRRRLPRIQDASRRPRRSTLRAAPGPGVPRDAGSWRPLRAGGQDTASRLSGPTTAWHITCHQLKGSTSCQPRSQPKPT
jgi:hypothetical protein